MPYGSTQPTVTVRHRFQITGGHTSWLAHLHRAGSLSTLALFVLAAVYASVKVIEQANEQGSTLRCASLSTITLTSTVGATLVASLAGLCCCLFSWGYDIVDSYRPQTDDDGSAAPEEWHFGQVMAPLNGLIIAAVVFGWLVSGGIDGYGPLHAGGKLV